MWKRKGSSWNIWEGGKWYNAAKIEAVKRLCSFISLASSQSGQILANENIGDSISSKEVFMFLSPWDMWFGCLNRTPVSSGPYYVYHFFLPSIFHILCVYVHHAHYVPKPNRMRRKSQMLNSVCFCFVHLNYNHTKETKKINMCNMVQVRRRGWVFMCFCFVYWIRTIQK